MDIKDAGMAKKLKTKIFKALHKCNWFLGIAFSASGMGLHIYTKIAIPENVDVPVMEGYSSQVLADTQKRKVLYLTNFRHKFSFVYIACLSAMDELGFSNQFHFSRVFKASVGVSPREYRGQEERVNLTP